MIALVPLPYPAILLLCCYTSTVLYGAFGGLCNILKRFSFFFLKTLSYAPLVWIFFLSCSFSKIACHNLEISMFFTYFSCMYKLYCDVRYTMITYGIFYAFLSVDFYHHWDPVWKPESLSYSTIETFPGRLIYTNCYWIKSHCLVSKTRHISLYVIKYLIH